MNNPTHPHRYLFTLVDGGGTVPVELGIVRRLVERGHDVTVIADASAAADVHASGAAFRPWATAPNRAGRQAEDDPLRDYECKSPIALVARILDRVLVGPAPAYAADTMAAIDELHPDLVVSSFFSFGSMVAAEARGVPFDVLHPNVYLLPAPGIPPFGLGFRPAKGGPGRLRDRLLTGMTGRQWNKGLPGLNALRTELGLDPVEDLFDQVHHSRRELVLTSADFDFPGEMPAPVRYTGPVLDDPAWAVDAAWTPPPGDDPLVLVAFSSTFQDHGGCLQRVADALGRLPVRGLVTTGPAVDPASIDAPANVTVVRAAPHSAVLQQAAAVVTHGGHGTVMRTLAADVPMVVIPHGRDQADNATRLRVRSAGVVAKRSASAKKIARAVEQLLRDPAYADGASRLGEAIRRDAASGAAINELEAIGTCEVAA
ncbi:MAG: glycosyltransferase [Acidimicrobiia bacterium]|nr:glycosyltransferase [Acidimicrobiia bacterium]